MIEAGSIRRRLILTIAAPLAVLFVISGVLAYRSALETARKAFDHALADDAAALAARVRADATGRAVIDLGPSAEAILRTDSEDREYFAAYGPDGRLLAGDEGLPAADVRAGGDPIVDDYVWKGEPVRRASFAYLSDAGLVRVAFAETLVKRVDASRQILVALVLPSAVLIIATLILVYLGLRNGLAPLVALGERISNRASTDLSPIPVGGVPSEARPLITEINTLIGNIRSSHAAQGRFLSEASHQLKTPLAGLATQLDLALDEVPDAVRPRVLWARDAAERMNLLVTDFLTLARAAPDASDIGDFEPIDLVDLLEEAASLWHATAADAGLDLGFEAETAIIRGIRWQVLEMLSNLIENAVRYTPAGGQVTVRCGRDPSGRAVLAIEDDGPGISRDEREMVFQRFYRGRDQSVSGTGLGLAIVASVAERHGATIDLSDGVDGRGLVVTVTFPVQQDA